jgi:hypothetical protein
MLNHVVHIVTTGFKGLNPQWRLAFLFLPEPMLAYILLTRFSNTLTSATIEHEDQRGWRYRHCSLRYSQQLSLLLYHKIRHESDYSYFPYNVRYLATENLLPLHLYWLHDRERCVGMRYRKPEDHTSAPTEISVFRERSRSSTMAVVALSSSVEAFQGYIVLKVSRSAFKFHKAV